MHHFTWPRGGMSGAEVEYILRQYGIRCTSREMGDQFGLSVPDKQANLAEYVLCHVKVPLTSPALNPRNAELAVAHGYTMPPPWGRPVGPGDAIGRAVDAFDGLFGGVASRPARTFVRSRAKSSKRRKAGGWWAKIKGAW